MCDSVSGVMPPKSRLNPDFTGHAKLQGSLGDPAFPQHLRCALSFLGKYHMLPDIHNTIERMFLIQWFLLSGRT